MSDVIVSAEAVEASRPVELSADLLDDQLIGQLVDRAQAGGLQLTGEGGLLQQLTKRVLESALEGEITDHLGYDKHDAAGDGSGQLPQRDPVQDGADRGRPGRRSRCPATVTAASSRRSVKKRQRRLTGVDEMVLSLSAKGLTHGEISAHLAEVYGAERVQADDLHDHRQGDGGHGRVAEPAARPGLPGDLHRLHPRQDPRRAGRQPADLRGLGGHRRRAPGHPRACGPATAARAPSTGCRS